MPMMPDGLAKITIAPTTRLSRVSPSSSSGGGGAQKPPISPSAIAVGTTDCKRAEPATEGLVDTYGGSLGVVVNDVRRQTDAVIAGDNDAPSPSPTTPSHHRPLSSDERADTERRKGSLNDLFNDH